MPWPPLVAACRRMACLDRRALDRVQRARAEDRRPDAVGGHRARQPALRRLVRDRLQPPLVGRHRHRAVAVQPAAADAEVLPEEGADLGAGARARVVGARVPVHAALPARGPREAAGTAAQGPRHDARCLPPLPDPPGLRAELPRGHAVLDRQARSRSSRRTVTCCCRGPAASPKSSRRWATSWTRCST